MSWMAKALETYENNQSLAGVVHDGEVPLRPIAHQMIKAQLEIALDRDGHFKNAQVVDNEKIIIPVTEESDARANGIAPHALNDMLGYIAGDFKQYYNRANEKKFDAYLAQLEQWHQSNYTTAKVDAIYQYVQQKHVIADLVSCGILKLDENGKLAAKGKISGADYEKVMVRFRVLDFNCDVDATWEDTELMNAYADYYCSIQSGKKDICYLTGKLENVATKHPKGTVASDFGAKLISTNDNINFTFRGRFTDASEACVVSYVVTQKAHAALAWLSQMQGVSIGNKDKKTYICWSPTGKKTDVFEKCCKKYDDDDEEDEPKTLPEYRKKLYSAFEGYTKHLITAGEKDSGVMIIGLDAATTGRLSVTYYNELQTSDFLNAMRSWQERYKWYFLSKRGGGVKPVTIVQLVKCAYGTERGNLIEVDDGVLKQQTERLLPSLLHGTELPWDLVHSLVLRASEPQKYSSWNREYVLSTACAVIAGMKRTAMKGEMDMELDRTCTDRNYLFGRLLAVCERVEETALYKKGEKRETNALKLQAAYVNHPATTWMTLETQLLPYYEKLIGNGGDYYKRLISEIIALMPEFTDQALNENYLPGYYLQRAEFRKKKQEINETETDQQGSEE